tara:strand:- start:1191 stop:1373 length:183 start_codon:yes stop_codon:yes gene_type:complete
MDKEKKSKAIQIILLSLMAIFYIITSIPAGTSIGQIIFAGVIFLLIIYFATRALKYFKII